MPRALLVMLAGCWSSSPAPAPEPVQNTAQLAEAEPVPEHSVWRGKYICRQGVTALDLTIDVAPSGNANAIFAFGPYERNPTVPSGSYRMKGTVKEAGAKLEVRLDPVEWLDQAEGYMMVGFRADSDRARHTLTGTITDPGCSVVEVRRIQ